MANDPSNSKYNVSIPAIRDGGEFTLNFWIYISGYTYLQGTRKHLVEIYPANAIIIPRFVKNELKPLGRHFDVTIKTWNHAINFFSFTKTIQ